MPNGMGVGALLARGGANAMKMLRPVLTQQMEHDARAGIAVNATLRLDEWRAIDAKVNDVARERITVAEDLRAAGLVAPISVGTVLRVTERLLDMDAATVSYDGSTPPEQDRPGFGRTIVPVPVIAKGFRINWRSLEASRERGEPLDTTAAAVAARKVLDQLQALITNGYASGPGTNPADGTNGQSIPGFTTAPHRLTVSLATAWDAAGADIIGDVERMLESAYASNLFGPFTLYVPKNYWAAVQKDYQLVSTVSTQTYMQRILAFVDIKAVRPDDALADDNVVLVQMTSDVLDLSEAQALTTIQWEKDPLVTEFRTLVVGGPQIKEIQTDAGTTINGIVHLS
jgi:uncharacterized linocin/CFP29 family protein